MFRQVIKKLLRLISVLFAVTALTFLMVDALPGDVAYEIAGEEATIEGVKAIREALGLDRHIFTRYVDWLSGVVQGDLGISLRTNEPVTDAMFKRLPITLELMLISQVFALALAIPIGVISAYRSQSGLSKALGTAAFAFMSVPVFVMALVLIYIFALKFRWFPATGFTPFSEGLLANLRSLMLPAASLALLEWAPLMRVLRSDMIATLQENFILSARAKGLPANRILLHHALKPSSFTMITILGIQIGHLVGGAVIVETIFALPGIGRLLVDAIYSRDLNMVQGCILLITIGYVAANFLVDALYAVLDPRVRVQTDR